MAAPRGHRQDAADHVRRQQRLAPRRSDPRKPGKAQQESAEEFQPLNPGADPPAREQPSRAFCFGHWSLVIGHWSLVIGHWSFIIRPCGRRAVPWNKELPMHRLSPSRGFFSIKQRPRDSSEDDMEASANNSFENIHEETDARLEAEPKF